MHPESKIITINAKRTKWFHRVTTIC